MDRPSSLVWFALVQYSQKKLVKKSHFLGVFHESNLEQRSLSAIRRDGGG